MFDLKLDCRKRLKVKSAEKAYLKSPLVMHLGVSAMNHAVFEENVRIPNISPNGVKISIFFFRCRILLLKCSEES